MITSELHKGTILSNASNESGFQMEASAAAFQILSGDIYEYKIAAVVRELMCNAWDSHLDAGHKEPFHINFPTMLNPYFSIEDFGIGLSEEEVRQVLTVYFKSTKKDKAESTGFLGLGAKSPMAYTDTFLICARKDGIENSFACYLNEENLPVVNLLNSNSTDKRNGVKFTIPVRSHDFEQFFFDAQFLASLFEVAPTTNRNDFAVTFPDAYNKLNETGVFIPKEDSNKASDLYSFVGSESNTASHYSNRKYIVMGNVAYRVNRFDMADDDGNVYDHDSRVWRFAKTMMDHTTFLKVPMGSVKFTASRETLSLTEQTKKVVTETAYQFYSNQLSKLEHDIQKASTPYEAMKRALQETSNEYFAFNVFTYEDRSLRFWAQQDLSDILSLFNANMYRRNPGRASTSVSARKINNDLHNGRVLQRLDIIRDKTVIVLPRNDSKGSVKYAREYAREHDAMVIGFQQSLRKTAFDRICKLLDHPTVVYVDDLRKADLDRKKAERAKLPKEVIKKKTESEVYAVAFASKKLTKGYSESFTQKAQTYDLSNDDIIYAYVNRSDPHSDLFRIDFGDESGSVMRETAVGNLRKQLYDFFKKEIVLLVPNQSNRKKIIRNKVPPVSELMKEARDAAVNDKEYFDWQVFRRLQYALTDEDQKIATVLEKANSPLYTESIRSMMEYLADSSARTVNAYTFDYAHWMVKDIEKKIQEVVEEKSKPIEELEAVLQSGDYPMFNPLASVDDLVRYVKMEDLYRDVQSI